MLSSNRDLGELSAGRLQQQYRWHDPRIRKPQQSISDSRQAGHQAWCFDVVRHRRLEAVLADIVDNRVDFGRISRKEKSLEISQLAVTQPVVSRRGRCSSRLQRFGRVELHREPRERDAGGAMTPGYLRAVGIGPAPAVEMLVLESN